jgi:hypothetical protein
MSQDFSVFGWMLPEQKMDVLIIPVIISLIGYIILFIIIRKLMKRFLNSKPWHKYLRRGIWIGIFTLMFFDPVYYFFWIEHGMCKADRARVYPAPPASYVVAGPMSGEELSRYQDGRTADEIHNNSRWDCKWKNSNQVESCYINNTIRDSARDLTVFSFVRDSDYQADLNSHQRYSEYYNYDTDGHWLTRFLFGYRIKFINSYKGLFSCATKVNAGHTLIILDKENSNGNN